MRRIAPKQIAIRDPEFECEGGGQSALEVQVQFGYSAHKTDCHSTLTLRGNQMGAYSMRVMVDLDDGKGWYQPVEVGAISIEINGDYERQELIDAFQQIGLLSLPVYGRIYEGVDRSGEESEDAVREQTPTI